MLISQIAFVANPQKPEAVNACVDAMNIAQEKGYGCKRFSMETLDCSCIADVELLVVIGGDGTILKAASCAAFYDIPILGVNLGRVGFLSEISPEQFGWALDELKNAKAYYDQRMTLDCWVNGVAVAQNCLNDLLLYKRSFSGVAYIGMEINGIDAGSVFCDGLIVSTPTGATGYSISAGGPVIAPGLDVAIVTPVCPHSLYMRPIVAAADADLAFRMLSEGSLYADGRFVAELEEHDSLRITRSSKSVRFVRVIEQNLYTLMRKKLS